MDKGRGEEGKEKEGRGRGGEGGTLTPARSDPANIPPPTHSFPSPHRGEGARPGEQRAVPTRDGAAWPRKDCSAIVACICLFIYKNIHQVVLKEGGELVFLPMEKRRMADFPAESAR